MPPTTPTPADAIKAALHAAKWTFIALFTGSLLGFLNLVGRWATAAGREPFPDVSTLGFAFISAAVAGLVLVIAAVYRLAQVKGFAPGQPPTYQSSTRAPLKSEHGLVRISAGHLITGGALLIALALLLT